MGKSRIGLHNVLLGEYVVNLLDLYKLCKSSNTFASRANIKRLLNDVYWGLINY